MPIKLPFDDKWRNDQSLGEKAERMFARSLEHGAKWALEGFLEALKDIIITILTILMPGAVLSVGIGTEKIANNKDMPEWLRNTLTKIGADEPIKRALTELFITWSSALAMVTGSLAPFRRTAEYRADSDVRSYLPSPQELATLTHIGLVSPQAYDENMSKLGVAEPLKPVYLEYVRNLPSLGEIFNGLWRGIYSESDFTNALRRMGYNDKDSKLFLELSKQIPPLQDLIRMLVRDAFNDSASSKYGYDEDYPTEINQYFAKQGYNPDWAKRYWRAHWNLPSPNQVYEMLHRGLIDTGTMEELLRISDYPKFWRDKLVGISYNVYTRVDLRRLLQSGIIDEAQALKGYKEMGYDEEKAQALVKFARIGVSEKEKDLTRTDIINLYEDNILDRGQVQDALVKMGYDSQEAEYLLDRADFNIAKSLRVDMINYTHERFIAKLIDKTGVITELTTTGLTQNQIDRYLLQWTRSTETNVTNISKADALKFFGGGYIDESQLRAYLSNLGYNQNDVDLYVRQANDSKSQTGERQA
jgi:hypothetical protein